MPGATKSQMLDEFQAIYGGQWEKDKLNEKKYINDLATIGSFLHPDNSLFCEALQKLDEAMVKLFESRTGTKFNRGSKIAPKVMSDFAHGRAVKPGQTIKVEAQDTGLDATKHLLTGVLASFEKSAGFSGVDEQTGKCVCFYNNLASDEFGAAIKTKHLGKDYVGSDHGTYTHRIQWYLAGIMKGELGLQSASMGVLFATSGRTWGRVFDRNAGEGVPLLTNDFRRPEYLNPWLASTARFGNYSWPVLSAFLKSRSAMITKRGWAPDVLRLNLASKLFGVKVSQNYRSATAKDNKEELEKLKLTPEQLEMLDKVVGGAVYDPSSNQLVKMKK
jgi:hypothetical protein